MTNALSRIALGGVLLAASGLLHASPIYTYSDATPSQNDDGGTLSDLTTSFDAGSDLFTWSYTVQDPSAIVQHNGFWLVVNDGPTNPKGDGNLAILYGDLVNERVSAYAYDGHNGPSSWQAPGATLLAAFPNSISVTEVTAASGSTGAVREVSVSIDVTDLNNYSPSPAYSGDWEGVSFDEQIGIWFHSVTGAPGVAVATYETDGSLKSFDVPGQGWIDTGERKTVVTVPEPGVLSLAALGLVAFGASRRSGRRRATL